MADGDVAATCASCGGPCQRFLFDHGARDARVIWECEQCGDSGVQPVAPDFAFSPAESGSYTLS